MSAENNGRSADQFYSATQLSGDDIELDSSWRNRNLDTSGSSLASDVQAREMAENDTVRDAFRKIKQILAEDDTTSHVNDQMQRRTRRTSLPSMTMEDLGLSPNENTGIPSYLTEGLSSDDLATLGIGILDGIDAAATQAFQDGYTGRGDELSLMAESNAGQPYASVSEWRTEKAMARLKSGKQVPVWLVVNEGTGEKLEQPFRIQSPAEKIAAILSVTGNTNEPRIVQITEDYNRHVHLTKTLRNAKKAIQEGKSINKVQYRKLSAELEGINHRLGI